MNEIAEVTNLRQEILNATSPTVGEELLVALGQKDPKAEQELRNLIANIENDVVSTEAYEQVRNIAISNNIPFSAEVDNKMMPHIRGQHKVVSKIFLHKVFHKDIIEELKAISPHIVFNGGTYPYMDQLPAGLDEKDSYDVRRGKLVDDTEY